MFWRGEKGGGNMAKKPTEKQLYKLKNEWLGQFFEEVKPKEFYRSVRRKRCKNVLIRLAVKARGSEV